MDRHGVRSEWGSMPPTVRDRIDEVAGAHVVSATNLQGGFSPGPAARCTLDDGRTVFVKAAGLELNPLSPAMHRREADALASLDAAAPSPELIGVVDDSGWIALVIEWVDGRMPTGPLDTDDVERILTLVDRLAEVQGDPHLPSVAADSTLGGHWARLRSDPLPGLDAWTTAHLPELVALEAQFADAVDGDHLVHMDLRSDNIIFASSGPRHDVIVDWPGASRGAPWLDLVGLLPSLELDGGPRPEDVFDAARRGRDVDPEAVNAYLATITGYFTRSSLLPPPPGLPTLRPFQAAQAAISRRWLGQRCGWAPH
ncbi:MAG: aminoglycoside phosphotransferase family protein [Ilumatobacteraceae bacterium]